jgi:hypothetical protein
VIRDDLAVCYNCYCVLCGCPVVGPFGAWVTARVSYVSFFLLVPRGRTIRCLGDSMSAKTNHMQNAHTLCTVVMHCMSDCVG